MVPLQFFLETQLEKTVMCVERGVDCLSFHTLSLQHCPTHEIAHYRLRAHSIMDIETALMSKTDQADAETV